MKKILVFILLIVSIQSFAQPTGFQKRIVNERIQGKFMVDSFFYLPRFTDTTQANLHKLVDTCGAMFFSYTKDSVFYRACNPKRWISVGSGSGGGVDSVVLRNDTLKYYSGGTGTVITPVVPYNFTSLADWDLLRYKASTGEFINFTSTRIDPTDPAIMMLVKDTVTNQEYYTDIPSGANSIQELDTLTDLDSASGNAAIIDGRLWIKYTSVGSWRRQAYDTTYSTPLMLDTYSGAGMALSLRKLRTAYAGSAIKVRRSSDNTEQDIGFLNGYLDTASLKTFVGANDGRIVTWYDQSGNSINGSQSTSGNQPYIISSGALLYDNGNVTIDFGDNNNPYYLVLPTGFLNGSTNLSYFQVAKITAYSVSNAGVFGPSNTASTGLQIIQAGVIGRVSYLTVNGTARNDGMSGTLYYLWTDATQSLTSIFGNASSMGAYRDGGAVTFSNSSAMPALNFNGVYAIGLYNSTTEDMYGSMQELVIYTTDKSASRTGIEGNINSFYTIF